MKQALILPIILMFTVNIWAQNRSIQFEHTEWNDVLKKAKKENKMIMLDCYASWCGPCQKMAKNIFTFDKVADYYNSNFINVKMDMEKGEGIELAKKYTVFAYPTFLFFDAQGNLVHKRLGFMDVDDFIQEGANAKNPEMQFFTLTQLYNESKQKIDDEKSPFKQNQNLLMNLITASSNAADNALPEYVELYLNRYKDDELLTKNNIYFIKEYVTSAESRGFATILRNYNKFVESFGDEEMEAKVEEIMSGKAKELGKNSPTEGKAELQKICNQLDTKKADKLYDKMLLSFYAGAKNWSEYANASVHFIEKYDISDADYLNSIGWRFYQKVDDKEQLNKAILFVEKGIKLKPEYGIMDTHACLLYKAERYDEAKKSAIRAIDTAKQHDEDASETEKLLVQIQDKLQK